MRLLCLSVMAQGVNTLFLITYNSDFFIGTQDSRPLLWKRPKLKKAPYE
ncbi:hypothetical protein IMCC3317_47150 [Kordia antarctica]|uniref:Uncharacterized protein n=1 Tax=Kordia antarctica TaxID=1218801 RepID=A0A7L4ZRS3_9FLAO|nr:hypothetical protein IMCC3317_47150 [Kordia antarctica]